MIDVMRTRIKFCGLVRPEDVRTAVALGVDAVGFVFHPRSPRFVRPDEAAALRRLLPSFVTAAGLFVNADERTLADTVGRVGLDVLQFHGDETPQQCQVASDTLTRPHWRAVRMRGPADLIESASIFSAAEAFLLDKYSEAYGGSGEGFDWSWLSDMPPALRERRLILAGGLTAQRVGAAITEVAPFAVDVSSGIQVDGDPRRKDRNRMEAFVQAVLQADAGRIGAPAGSEHR